MKKQFIISIIALIISSCNNETENSQGVQQSEDTTKPELTEGINPPVAGLDVPFMSKQITAEEGGTFVYETGSIVTFPKNAVLHADGTPVEGAFDVEYREFQDPIDIYFSGIPMSFDSVGVSYQFISAGMCELKAYQNGEELIVNPEANPSVDMVSKDIDPAHNLYFYDEEGDKWDSKGKSKMEDFQEPENQPEELVEIPVKPQKINSDKYSFYISIDELGSEFAGFDNMYFQIADEEKNYDPSDAQVQWYSVDVKKSPKLKGKYLVTFANASMSRTYITDPVFSDEEYDKAMANYDKVMAEKAEAIKIQEEKMAKWEAEQAKIIAQNRIIDSINQVIAKQKEMTENEDFVDFKFPQGEYTIRRGFQVSSFGIWNCDNPKFTQEDFVDTKVSFTGSENDLSANRFSVIYETYNSVYDGNVGSFRNLPSTREIVFLVEGSDLYYGKVDSKLTQVSIDLNRMDISNTSFKEVKKKLLSI